MTVNLSVWRQASSDVAGKFEEYKVTHVSPNMSFLEMLDVLNDRLVKENKDPIEFDSDCREGICGTCGCMINGQAHGPQKATTTCQLYMRSFKDGDTLVIEPWRAKAFPVIKDLVVDRGAFDRIIGSGGYTSAKTGQHADANAILIPKDIADRAMDAATCIGCGACVAACPNASASLFTSAKIAQLSLLPQGQVEKTRRVEGMVNQMDKERFGGCTNIGECEAACPVEISLSNIAIMKTEYAKATIKSL
ncbi:MAG: succinate dehydrogenase/fumarate reductase iron-sulfur subunit [Oligoflexia bacterium]|nr:succinate dehydrogenase/fumarate reductase iron-sulfur subunit [Oligoflexia bacterium]